MQVNRLEGDKNRMVIVMYGVQYCADTTTCTNAMYNYIDMLLVMISTTVCSPLPGNQILIRKYLARRGVVVSGGWSNGSRWQQTTKLL